jgi:hypothetical protein
MRIALFCGFFMTKPLPSNADLQTWKEIAEYLRISVREAQNREKDGMPVHRLPGKKSQVFAYTEELDDWHSRVMTTRKQRGVEITDVPTRPEASRRTVLLAAIGGIGALAVGGVLLSRRPPEPERAVLQGNLLTALDGLGRQIWTHRFEENVKPCDEREARWRVQLVDFDGSGRRGVLVACQFVLPSGFDPTTRSELFYFSPEGRLVWRRAPIPDLLDFDGREFAKAWRITHVITTPPKGPQTVWMSVAHDTRWAGAVLEVSRTGALTVRMANAGNVECLSYLPTRDGGVLFASGENNAYDCAFLASFPAAGPARRSPPGGPPRYKYANTPTEITPTYILFPAEEVNLVKHSPYGNAKHHHYEDTVSVLIWSGSENSYLTYDFSNVLAPEAVSPSGSYPLYHKELEQEGLLKHSFADCPETKRPMSLRRWESATGWQDQEIPWRLPANLVG